LRSIASPEEKDVPMMTAVDAHPAQFKVLVTLGESTTAGGWSSGPERCWASRLAAFVSDVQSEPVQLVNSGIGANVISSRSPAYEHSGKPAALDRLDKHVIAHEPDLLVVSYGLNDARGGTPMALFVEQLEELITRVRAACQPLVLLPGPYYMTDFTVGDPHFSLGSRELFGRYNDAIAALAQRTDCLFVDLLAAYGDAPWLVHHDGVHANDVGHLIVAMALFTALASRCSGLAAHTRAKEAEIPPWRDESTLQSDYGH
jgi:lysophospholipase L1-like esterase